ncbi:hypothetical protein HAX54_031873, partial [Datura stramonium]|nr:hypothetical protein [Datura stramonium]
KQFVQKSSAGIVSSSVQFKVMSLFGGRSRGKGWQGTRGASLTEVPHLWDYTGHVGGGGGGGQLQIVTNISHKPC